MAELLEFPKFSSSWRRQVSGNKCICLLAPRTQADTLIIGRRSSQSNITLNELWRCDSTQAAQAPGGRCTAAGTSGVAEVKLHFVSWLVKPPPKKQTERKFRETTKCSVVEHYSSSLLSCLGLSVQDSSWRFDHSLIPGHCNTVAYCSLRGWRIKSGDGSPGCRVGCPITGLVVQILLQLHKCVVAST